MVHSGGYDPHIRDILAQAEGRLPTTVSTAGVIHSSPQDDLAAASHHHASITSVCGSGFDARQFQEEDRLQQERDMMREVNREHDRFVAMLRMYELTFEELDDIRRAMKEARTTAWNYRNDSRVAAALGDKLMWLEGQEARSKRLGQQISDLIALAGSPTTDQPVACSERRVSPEHEDRGAVGGAHRTHSAPGSDVHSSFQAQVGEGLVGTPVAARTRSHAFPPLPPSERPDDTPVGPAMDLA